LGDTFDAAMTFLFDAEGDYSDDADDSGGPTRYGITQRTLSDMREKSSLALPASIRDLTKRQARSIYRHRYWPPFRKLPSHLAFLAFDTGANCGTKTAAKMLQRALKIRPVDGIVGPQTLSAARVASNGTLERLAAARLLYYEDLVARRPVNRKFLGGWFARTVRCAIAAHGCKEEKSVKEA
jgi:lysozyme family protein